MIESFRDLQEDYTKTSADLLRLLVNSTSVEPETFHPSAGARWVSALWLSSLSITLIAALGGMWGKMWAQNLIMESHEGASGSNSNLWENAKESGQKMVQTLAMVIHVAIILFMVGLIVFVWNKALVLGGILCGFAGLGILAYLYSNQQRKGKWYKVITV